MANKTRLRIITPDRTFFDDEIEMVIMRTTIGDVGIMPGHIPLTTTISYGVVFITKDDKEYRASLFGGFAVVKPKEITIVSDSAEWPREIDKKRAEDSKDRAEKRLIDTSGNSDLQRAEIALRKAIVRIELSSYKLDEYGSPLKMEQV